MKPLGIGIVGTGNIAGGYARDILTHPEIRLVAASDLDPVRAAAFAEARGCRAHASLDGLLADEAVDVVVNLTVHHAHFEVTRRALEAGRHVYSEKPLALRSTEARELIALAAARGLRLGCSPATFLGEAQQTAAAWIRDNRLGTVRAIYADRLGWFDGNATRLFPLTERERGAKIIDLGGGADRVLARARDALAARDFQWAAELADYVLAVDGVNGEGKRIKAQALMELGERQMNANARNYYLSAAQYLLGGLPPQ
jgi:predicted dehydrogenase